MSATVATGLAVDLLDEVAAVERLAAGAALVLHVGDVDAAGLELGVLDRERIVAPSRRQHEGDAQQRCLDEVLEHWGLLERSARPRWPASAVLCPTRGVPTIGAEM
jgi:hypothetical protein